MTKAWIFVSCKSEDLERVYRILGGYNNAIKLIKVRGIWDFILEISDSDLNVRITRDCVEDLFGVQTTQILTEI